MSVQREHLEKLEAYIAEHGEQRQGAICAGMRQVYPDVDMRRYLFKLLRKEGRIEKVGYDSYRAAAPEADGSDASETLRFFDIADHLNTPEAIAEYVIATFEDGNPEIISDAIGDVATAMAILLVKKRAAS